jgi:hypothetical protein
LEIVLDAQPSYSLKGKHMTDGQNTVPWGVARIASREPLVPPYPAPEPASGAGIVVAVIGGGFDLAAMSSYVLDPEDYGVYTPLGDSSTFPDSMYGAHGTQLAHIIADPEFGVAPGSRIMAVRVTEDDGTKTTQDALVKGFEYTLCTTDLDGNNPDQSRAPRIVLLAAGLEHGSKEWLDDFLDAAEAASILVVAAAGDHSGDASQYFSALESELPNDGGTVASNLLVVGASTSDDALWPMSNTGTAIDIFAPGHDIPTRTTGNQPATVSSTAAAAAHVAGVAARILSHEPDWDPRQVKYQMIFSDSFFDILDLTGALPGTPNRLLHHQP